MRWEYGGKKQKAAPQALQDKLAKACRCHLTLPPGNHKDRCSLKPENLHAALRMNVANRAAIEQQLRTRTTLTPKQRGEALAYLFGPEVVLQAPGSSGSGALKTLNGGGA